MAWASTPPCSPRSGCFLVSRKTPTLCRLFLGAEAGEAEVHQPPLVLIGGGCFTENADIVSAFPWRASARWCSLAASCRRVAVGVGGRAAAGNMPLIWPLLAFLVDSCGTEHREARGASRGNAFQGSKRGFPQLALRASKRGAFLPVAAKPHRQTVRCRRSFKLCGARARGCPCPRASCGASEARQANRSERAVNGGQGRPM